MEQIAELVLAIVLCIFAVYAILSLIVVIRELQTENIKLKNELVRYRLTQKLLMECIVPPKREEKSND